MHNCEDHSHFISKVERHMTCALNYFQCRSLWFKLVFLSDGLLANGNVCVFIDASSSPGRLAVRATVNILDWKLVLVSGAFSRMFAAANC